MTGNTHLEIKLLKNPFSKVFYNNQGTRKKKTSRNFPIRISTSPFNQILLNASSPLNWFHGQTLWENTIILVLIFRVKSVLKFSDGYIVFIWYKFIHFPLHLNPAILRMDTSPIILCPMCRENSWNAFSFCILVNKMSLIPFLYVTVSSLKLH